MEVKVKKLRENAILPRYATDGSGCFDLYAAQWGTLYHGEPCIFGTGLSFEIPEGCVLLVFSRSGQGFNKDIRLANCVGVIDSDYRGEVKIKLTQDNSVIREDTTVVIDVGDAIAQAMIIPIPKVDFVEVESLSETLRGEGGFGSTDNK